MGKRIWKVEWVACPAADGIDRLSQAVQLVIDHAVARPAAAGEVPGGERPQEWSHE